MVSGNQLGISYEYEVKDRDTHKYTLRPSFDTVKTPKELRERTHSYIDVLINIASKKGDLEDMVFIVDSEENKDLLESTMEDLTKESLYQKKVREHFSDGKTVHHDLTINAARVVGVTYAAAAYFLSADLATNVAENMNELSSYLAGATGIVQSGISLGAAGIYGYLSYILSSGVGYMASKSIVDSKTPLADKHQDYLRTQVALNKASILNDEPTAAQKA